MGKVIGIDLGTSTSCVSVFEGGQPTVIVNSEGNRTTPSVVGFVNGERKVGDAARRQAITNPKNTVYAIKRFMGIPFDKAQKEADRVTYNVINEGGYPRVDIDSHKYTPQEISATILQKMKKTAEDYLGTEVKDAVITVPAYFDDSQRKATIEAGQIAGLNVLRIINEPTAAALAYGVDKANKDMNIVVYDIGGGTSDVSILNFGGGVFEVISTNGDSHLGGEDFDQAIVNYLVEEFEKQEGVNVSSDAMAMQRLKEAAEKAKIELSTATSTDINLPYLAPVNGTPKHLMLTLTRAKFEQLTENLYNKLIELCKEALRLSKLETKDIDEVILVGGSTRIPKVVEAAKTVFQKDPSKAVNPDEAVSLGAAIQGAVLNKEDGVGDIVLLDVTPLNLGIETLGGVMTTLIEANTTIPCDKEEVFSTAADNQTEVTINLLQGNRPMANQNKSIGRFNLTGILPAKRGIPQIAVKISINANGVIEVSATDKGTGKAQSIRVEGSSSLSKEEIERMKAEAEANADADKKERETADAVNKGDNIAFAQEKMIEEQKGNLTSDEKTKLEGLVSQMKDAVKAKDVNKINELEASINETWQTVSQRVYANNQSQQTTTQQPTDEEVAESAAEQPNDVQDADFEVVS
jgi:molecular chaperone DnaK